jgi:hypothetical protein
VTNSEATESKVPSWEWQAELVDCSTRVYLGLQRSHDIGLVHMGVLCKLGQLSYEPTRYV